MLIQHGKRFQCCLLMALNSCKKLAAMLDSSCFELTNRLWCNEQTLWESSTFNVPFLLTKMKTTFLPLYVIKTATLSKLKVILTFLLSLMLVKIAWTRHVLLNIEPKAKVNPVIKTQARPWLILRKNKNWNSIAIKSFRNMPSLQRICAG